MITNEDIITSKNTPAYKAFCKGLAYGYRIGKFRTVIFNDVHSLWQQFIGQIRSKK